MIQAIGSTRPGGHVGFVGVSHDVAIPGDELFMAGVHIHGGPAPVRRFLPELIQLIWDRRINPGKVFDSPCHWTRWPRATRPWTGAPPPRSCSPSDTCHTQT
jgi:threonine dehydrogenase-like Zn-dependent dehydrogenase